MSKVILPSIYSNSLASVPAGGITIEAMLDIAADFQIYPAIEILSGFFLAMAALTWGGQTYTRGNWKVGKRELKQQVFQKSNVFNIFDIENIRVFSYERTIPLGDRRSPPKGGSE
jgi:hypothetical protein